MSVELLDLPDLPLGYIFRFLSVKDLKNVRLVSTWLDDAVIKMDKRFRIWTIRILGGLPHATDKVFEGKIKMKIVIDNKDRVNNELFGLGEFETWLMKHSCVITGLSFVRHDAERLRNYQEFCKINPEDLDTLFEAMFMTDNLVKIALAMVGSQIETITAVNYHDEQEPEYNICLSHFDLPSLKHVQLYSNKEFRDDFLEKLPDTVESLDIQTPDDPQNIEFEEYYESYTTDHLKRLKTLKVYYPGGWYDQSLNLQYFTPMVQSSSLTSLYFACIELKYSQVLDNELPALKILGITECWIEMKAMKKLLMKSSRSLSILILEISIIVNDNHEETKRKCLDLEAALPRLTTLKLDPVDDVSPCSVPIIMCSQFLTTLVYCGIDFLNPLNCDLPALKTLSISNLFNYNKGESISSFLKKCPSLQTLHLAGRKDKVDVLFFVDFETTNIPNLKELYVGRANVRGIKNLALPETSKVETIGLRGSLEGPIWTEIVECSFPNLKAVYMHGLTKEQVRALENNIITADMEVFLEDREKDWLDYRYRHVQCTELKKSCKYLHEKMKEEKYTKYDGLVMMSDTDEDSD